MSCRVLPDGDEEAAISWARAQGATQWPSGSIVNPETVLRSSSQAG